MPSGVVTEFDADRGLGTITSTDGRTLLFHVVEIVDGTRAVDHGAQVTFDRLAKFGQVEAGSITKV